MNERIFRRSHWISRPLPEAFAFFERPENLAVITPPDLGFRILTPSPIEMKAGSIIDYTVRVFGVPLRWRTRIDSYDPPHGFADTQVRGPYAYWRHTHSFASENGGTRMIDEVYFSPPLGLLGSLAMPWIERNLNRIFDFREIAISRLFPKIIGGHTMKIVVAGGSGFVGRKLIERLLASGHQVSALTRRPGKACLPPGARPVAWDPTLDEGWKSLVREADAVINLCGENIAAGRWTRERKQAILESRTVSTRVLAESMGPRSVLLNASAVGYYGNGAEPADETAPKGRGFLADVCQRWEEEAQKAEKQGARVVLLRLGAVLGLEGGALAKMLLPFRLGLGGRLGSGRQPFPWIHVEDAVGLMEACLNNPNCRGPVNAVAPDSIDNARFVGALARVLHRPAILPAPSFVLKLIFGEMAGMLLEGRLVEPNAAIGMGYRFRYPDIDSALKELIQK